MEQKNIKEEKSVHATIKRGLILGMITLSLTFSMFGCAAKATKYFDSEEDLREAVPHLYYFHFDLNEMRLTHARALSNDFLKFDCEGRPKDLAYNYIIYDIFYDFYSDAFGEAHLTVECAGHSSEQEKVSSHASQTIDDVMCWLDYDITEENYNIWTAFKLEESTYRISISGSYQNHQEQDILDYFLEIVTPAIESRQKGNLVGMS